MSPNDINWMDKMDTTHCAHPVIAIKALERAAHALKTQILPSSSQDNEYHLNMEHARMHTCMHRWTLLY